MTPITDVTFHPFLPSSLSLPPSSALFMPHITFLLLSPPSLPPCRPNYVLYCHVLSFRHLSLFQTFSFTHHHSFLYFLFSLHRSPFFSAISHFYSLSLSLFTYFHYTLYIMLSISLLSPPSFSLPFFLLLSLSFTLHPSHFLTCALALPPPPFFHDSYYQLKAFHPFSSLLHGLSLLSLIFSSV